jgi:hypothetical protein
LEKEPGYRNLHGFRQEGKPHKLIGLPADRFLYQVLQAGAGSQWKIAFWKTPMQMSIDSMPLARVNTLNMTV